MLPRRWPFPWEQVAFAWRCALPLGVFSVCYHTALPSRIGPVHWPGRPGRWAHNG